MRNFIFFVPDREFNPHKCCADISKIR